MQPIHPRIGQRGRTARQDNKPSLQADLHMSSQRLCISTGEGLSSRYWMRTYLIAPLIAVVLYIGVVFFLFFLRCPGFVFLINVYVVFFMSSSHRRYKIIRLYGVTRRLYTE